MNNFKDGRNISPVYFNVAKQMKSIFLIISLLCTYLVYAKNTFQIKGKIKGFEKKYIHYSYYDLNENYIKDSCFIEKGNFFIEGHISQPQLMSISCGVSLKRINVSSLNYTEIFIEPTKMLLFLEKDNFKKYKLENSTTDSEKQFFENSNSIIQKSKNFENLVGKLEQSIDLGFNDRHIKDSLNSVNNLWRELSKEINQEYISYLKNHTNSYYSIHLLRNYVYRLSIDSIKIWFSRFSDTIQNSFNGKRVSAEIRAIEGGGPGQNAKQFRGIDSRNKLFSLDSVLGKKLVLLDFWATWCVPCIQEIPFLKFLNKQFLDSGLLIISIANDDEREKVWKQFIEDYQISGWVHILQLANTQNDIGKLYGIQPIPTKILIGKDKKIKLRIEGLTQNNQIADAIHYYINQ